MSTTWYTYTDFRIQHTVVGTLRATDAVYSPQLHNRRKLFVHLPPSYATTPDRRYPVIYMQDGQNLFDQALSYAGEWQVDETMVALSNEGIEAIVVGIPNMGVRRIDEYSPFRDPRVRRGGRGDWYVAFVANTVKPLIDAEFRTLPEREHTGLLGSSMGGLISLYGFFARPDIFGFTGVMSPSLWFAREAIFSYVQQAPYQAGRIYLDIGTYEGADWRQIQRSSQRYVNMTLQTTRRMRDLLAEKGYLPGVQLRYDEEAGAVHNEAAWARRLPGAVRFLLGHDPSAPGSAVAETWWEF